MITVEKTDANLLIKIPNDSVPPKRLNALLDWLRFEETAQRSRLSEVDADRLAAELKAGWWAANKERFITRQQQ